MRTITSVLPGLLLSSCFRPVDLNKDAPITSELLSKLEPGQKYLFELKSGPVLTIFVTAVEDNTITGYSIKETKGASDKTPFSDTFEHLQQNVARISHLKLNKRRTVVAVVVPIASSVALAFLIQLFIEMSQLEFYQ